jgi:hypothetical protein
METPLQRMPLNQQYPPLNPITSAKMHSDSMETPLQRMPLNQQYPPLNPITSAKMQVKEWVDFHSK